MYENVKIGYPEFDHSATLSSGEIKALIVSIIKLLIVIGSPRVYLSRNRRAITWVSNYMCPI